MIDRLGRFWLIAIVVLLHGEAFLLITYFDARQTHSDNVAGGCRGEECFSTGFSIIFWLFWVFAWPVVGLIGAVLARKLWRMARRRAMPRETSSFRTVTNARCRR